MPPKKENSKKVAGNAKKAAAANAKAEAENAKKAAAEDEEWKKGSKSNAKKEESEAKKREAAAKKAAREAALAEEEQAIKTVKTNPKAGKKAAPAKRAGGLDAALGQFEGGPSTISASGIDDALDALSLTHGVKAEVDRHPERRFKAAYAAYEERRLPEIKIEHPGLRQNQMKELIRKEFEKSEENPFNKAGIVAYDADREQVAAARKAEKERIEKRLGRP